jgi:hypothetical protein
MHLMTEEDYESKYNAYAFASLLCTEPLTLASQTSVLSAFLPLNKGAIEFSTHNSYRSYIFSGATIPIKCKAL